jgi:hypothetical protein
LEDYAIPTSTTAKAATTSRATTVPKFNNGEQLQAWAVSKGLPEAEVGMSTHAYYQLLCNTLERRQQAKIRKEKLTH